MERSSSKVKSVIIILLCVFLVDTIISSFWVSYINPDASVSIYLIYLVPLLVIINLVLAGIFFLFRSKNISLVFIINTIVAPLIFVAFFDRAADKSYSDHVRLYRFSVSDKNYELMLLVENGNLVENGDFHLSRKINENTYDGVLWGKYKTVLDTILLINDSVHIRIFNKTLCGFPMAADKIKIY